MGLEVKDFRIDLKAASKGGVIEGYASRFGEIDRGGDMVMRGAYAASLARVKADGGSVKMLWQHNPEQPIGVWDEIHEDDQGLFVKGRLLTEVAKAREAVALIDAGAIDGLSIGYCTVKCTTAQGGAVRVLEELDLWEVSVVTFPMQDSARIGGKSIPEEITEKLKAGGRLSEREFEAMAKGLGCSNSQAERAARVHLKGQGEPVKAANEAREFFGAILGQ